MEEGVTSIDCPTHSLDLNPMENLWTILSFEVYANCDQYESLDDLKEAILDAWERIPPHFLTKLCDSMVNRCVAVIDRRGGRTKY